MNWKFWKKESEEIELIPILPDHRLIEEENRFEEMMEAWIKGDPPFKRDRGPDLLNRRSLAGELDNMRTQISLLQKRVSHLEGNDPPGNTCFPEREEYHVARWLDEIPNSKC